MRQQVVLKVVKQVIKKTFQTILLYIDSHENARKKTEEKFRQEEYIWCYAREKYVVRDTTLDKYQK